MLRKILTIIILVSCLISQNYGFQNSSDINQIYDDYIKLAEAQKKMGDFESALNNYSKAFDIAKKQNVYKKKHNSLINQGLMLWQLGFINEAIEFYSKAHLSASEIKNSDDIIISSKIIQACNLYIQGKLSRKKHEYSNSIEEFRNSIQLLNSIGYSEKTIKCLRQLSLTFWMINEVNTFYSLNEEALILAEKHSHRKEQVNCLLNIGIYLRKADNLSNSLISYEKALSIAEELNLLDKISACLNNIGIIYKDLGNYEKSILFLKKALSIDEKLENDVFISIDLINLGETIRLCGHLNEPQNNWRQALEYFSRALYLAKKNEDIFTEVRILNNIGTIYSDLKINEKALDFFNEAFNKATINNEVETIGMTLNNMGVVYHNLGNIEKSNLYFDKAINLAKKTKSTGILWEAYFERGNNLKKQNKINDAILLYKRSIELIEHIRSQINLEENRAKYLGSDKRMEVYFNIIDALYTQYTRAENKEYYFAQAFNYMEKAKARTFLDSLSLIKPNNSHGIASVLLEKESNLMQQFSNLNKKILAFDSSKETENRFEVELKSLENKLENLKREIREENPYYANLKYPEIISIEKTQNHLLNGKTSIYAFMLGKESSYLFIIKKKKKKIVRLPKKEDIQKIVKQHLFNITDYENNNFNSGLELYSLLFNNEQLENDHNIIIVPDDILHFLPFETLKTKTYKWLVENNAISYAPSVSSLEELINNKKNINDKPKKDFLGFGNPRLPEINSTNNQKNTTDIHYIDNFSLSDLKFSSIEVDRIGSLFKKKNTSILKEMNANEESLKKSSISEYKIIHFASHALIDNVRPDRSSILLSLDNNPKEDGLLQTREIYNLSLNADLVTISACSSGLGQLIKGEGIIGLNRAFFYAGASAVLMSLWAINDRATFHLMEKFYKHLNSSKSITQSLTQAKIDLINSNELSHPYYWAGFILSGHTNKIVFKSKLNNYISILASIILIISLYLIIMCIKPTYKK